MRLRSDAGAAPHVCRSMVGSVVPTRILDSAVDATPVAVHSVRTVFSFSTPSSNGWKLWGPVQLCFMLGGGKWRCAGWKDGWSGQVSNVSEEGKKGKKLWTRLSEQFTSGCTRAC